MLNTEQLVIKVRVFWATLPHQVQAGLVIFAAAVSTSITKYYSDPNTACWQWMCIKHYLFMSGASGLTALRAFYMLPNGTGKAFLQAQLQAEADRLQNRADILTSASDKVGVSLAKDTMGPAPVAIAVAIDPALIPPLYRHISPPGGVIKAVN